MTGFSHKSMPFARCILGNITFYEVSAFEVIIRCSKCAIVTIQHTKSSTSATGSQSSESQKASLLSEIMEFQWKEIAQTTTEMHEINKNHPFSTFTRYCSIYQGGYLNFKFMGGFCCTEKRTTTQKCTMGRIPHAS